MHSVLRARASQPSAFLRSMQESHDRGASRKRPMEEPACLDRSQDGRRHDIYRRVDLTAGTDKQRRSRPSAGRALMPGALVVVTGNPLRDPAQIRASFPDYKESSNTNIVDVIQIRRMDDSWSWAQTPPECK